MSDVSQGPGWWLASDGKWYPPETAPQPLAPPPPLASRTAAAPAASNPGKRNWKKIGLIGGGIFVALMVVGALTSPPKDEKVDASSKATATTAAPTTTIDPEVKAIKAGNVALCNDGGYSDNTDFSATCSGGDGIDKWLATFGECRDGTIIKLSATASCDDNDGFKRLLPAGYEPKPAKGDIAQCKDRTFSDNTDFSATCSSRGGVDRWLAPYGTCKDGTVVKLSKTASCDDHDGFKALLPADYTPPTTTTTAPPPTTAPPATAPPAPAETMGQSNARESAASYLDFKAFSRSGLIKQLEFEGFSTADATYGVDALHVDWNEQAAKSAAEYLDFKAFSRSGLIDQLVFEGFSRAEAEYGVSTTGL